MRLLSILFFVCLFIHIQQCFKILPYVAALLLVMFLVFTAYVKSVPKKVATAKDNTTISIPDGGIDMQQPEINLKTTTASSEGDSSTPTNEGEAGDSAGSASQTEKEPPQSGTGESADEGTIEL